MRGPGGNAHFTRAQNTRACSTPLFAISIKITADFNRKEKVMIKNFVVFLTLWHKRRDIHKFVCLDARMRHRSSQAAEPISI